MLSQVLCVCVCPCVCVCVSVCVRVCVHTCGEARLNNVIMRNDAA